MENEFATRLLIAALLGAVLGIERSIAGKHAGMRTYAMVSLGSALFALAGVLAAQQFSPVFSGINPLTVGSNVVVAIGFLGAGLTVFRGEHPVELTTAAGLWVSAGVGLAAGFGLYDISVTATILSLLIFSLLLPVENLIRHHWGSNNR